MGIPYPLLEVCLITACMCIQMDIFFTLTCGLLKVSKVGCGLTALFYLTTYATACTDPTSRGRFDIEHFPRINHICQSMSTKEA